ncbi:hypothetical protein ABZX95_23240 [Streptomyces sp. NPDC004232]|uniref:hypothetical protein n=1 Tax=Streptomyces sp. NPDC004232 TaxID=3154454 RepID=UPI001D73E57C|nr:hypothetical protein [Streptomyces sp. tea 10]
MPRGRHRHSPPLHRLLPPSAIAGVSVVCALGPWAFSGATVLRALAAAAAATAVVGAIVMRRWDAQAGKQVAELTRARASDEWRNEERVAELETDLEESRELRTKLEQRLRAKRAELAGLRNEHAALLRRYATAETERASALEGRRLLEIEAAEPSSSLALPPARSAESQQEPEPVAAEATEEADREARSANAVFSSEGAWLYKRALTALAGFEREAPAEAEAVGESAFDSEAVALDEEKEKAEPEAAEDAAPDAEFSDDTDSDDTDSDDTDSDDTDSDGAETETETEADSVAKGEGAEAVEAEAGADEDAADAVTGDVTDSAGAAASEAAAPSAALEPVRPLGQPPAGHFTVPTAVAVVPAAPARRPVVEGGFDFFGTQKAAPEAALDSVQNEDLADVVGQEALAVHKAEAEAAFKPAAAQADGAGQVIDLTAHDETEQIDVQGLRSAAS